MDSFSRRAVGWAIFRQRAAELMCGAPGAVLKAHRPPQGLFRQSDKGVQLCFQRRAAKGAQTADGEKLEAITCKEGLELEIRKDSRSQLRLGSEAPTCPNKAPKKLIEDPKMPNPTEEEPRLLISVNLECKEPSKWFYKSLLDTYRSGALFSHVRKAKAPVLP